MKAIGCGMSRPRDAGQNASNPAVPVNIMGELMGDIATKKYIETNWLYRGRDEEAADYLMRAKHNVVHGSLAWAVHHKTLERAFTEFIKTRPTRKRFCAVVDDLTFTASMLYDIWKSFTWIVRE